MLKLHSFKKLAGAVLLVSALAFAGCRNASDSNDGTTDQNQEENKTNNNENENSNNNNSGTDTTETTGEQQEDGSYLVLDWDASAYSFTEETDSTSVSGTYGDVAVLSGKSKANAGYIQLSKKGSASSGLKFYVPINASKIVVTAKVGSSSATSATAVVATSDETEWKESFTVSYQTADSSGTLKNAAKDYEFEPSFTATTDSEGTTLTQKTIVLYNSDDTASINITNIKVYAPTAWTKSSDSSTPSTVDTNTGDKYNETDNSDAAGETLPSQEATLSNATISITESAGWLESAYIKFTPLSNAKSYTVKVDGTQLDDALIRTYASYVRADALGLTAGEHTMTVSATLEDGSVTAESSATMTVIAHERTGFAFTSETLPGAYKADGTLKDNAIVLYVTNDTFDTVSLEVNKNAKGEKITLTGVQDIVNTSGYWKYASYNNDAPLVIRIIGTINTTGFPSSSWGSSAEGLQVKGSGKVDTMVTIEGVGDDATIYGFGILCRSTKYVELRNFAVMLCKDDCISLDTDNLYTWVHNLDLFYGNAGSDSDQAKGDGTLDVKGDSQYQTYSYNHFWDSGKSSLCGMKSESGPNYITYHHNWFDHSDSRHPRVRSMSVHVFNNYFDGNSKYGVGAAYQSSIFVEGNFFRNAHDPMMSSKQGTDATGDGTFSGEDGGIIKAYNNKFTECNTNGVKFQYVTNKDVDDNNFDAYVVDSRDETVPSTVKAVQGSSTYDNFDTTVDTGVTADQVDEPDTAKAKVVAYSGRHNPDFTWTFDNATDDASYAVNTELKAALQSYTSSLVSVQGTSSSSSSGSSDSGDDNGSSESGESGSSESGESGESDSGSTVDGAIVVTFDSFTSGATVNGVTITGNLKSGVSAKTYNGVTYTTALKMESKTSISFTTSAAATLTLITDTASKSIKIDDTKYTTDSDGVVSQSITAGSHTVAKGDSMNVYAIIITPAE